MAFASSRDATTTATSSHAATTTATTYKSNINVSTSSHTDLITANTAQLASKTPSQILSMPIITNGDSSGYQTGNGDYSAPVSNYHSAAPPSPILSTSVKQEDIYDQDTDDEAFCHLPVAIDFPDTYDESYSFPSPVVSAIENGTTKSSKDKITKRQPYNGKRKQVDIVTTKMKCDNCMAFKRRVKFSMKQWQRGTTPKSRKVHCRRCEEKSVVRKKVGRKLEKHCIRIHTKTSRRSDATYLSTVIPMNTKLVFLPSELTLDGYTRESWSLEGNTFESTWQTVTLRCLVGEEKMMGFVNFLKERKKSAYGTFALKDGTDGFFFVPFYQPPQAKLNSLCKSVSSTMVVCKYILGLGLMSNENKLEPSAATSTLSKDDLNEGSEDYISSSMLGSLLFAQSRTESSLTVVPKGSVKTAPKLEPRPNRKRNIGYSRDWYGPKIFIKEGKHNDENGS